MKTILTSFLMSLMLVALPSGVPAQDTLSRSGDSTVTQKDTMKLRFLEVIGKGDVLPFNLVYQRARLNTNDKGDIIDTVLMLSIQKDFAIEVVENNREKEYVMFDYIQGSFKKSGPFSDDPGYSQTTNLLSDGYPLRLGVSYGGYLFSDVEPDTLKARAEKNLAFIADTMSKSSEDVSREQIIEDLSYMKDPSYLLSQAISGLNSIFQFCGYEMAEGERYSYKDSLFCDIDSTWYSHPVIMGWTWDQSQTDSSRDAPFNIQSISAISGMPFLSYMGCDLTKEEAVELLEKAREEGKDKRFTNLRQVEFLADNLYGIPLLIQTTILNGFYESIDDNAVGLDKIIIVLDVEKFVQSQEDSEDEDDEDNEEDEPRYDDYGFIKVK